MFKAPVTKTSKQKRTFAPQDVDKYVQKIESRLLSPVEKKSNAFAFARLYFDAKDFNKAKLHLDEFLCFQDRDYRVYNLLGEVEENLGNYPQALAAFKRSLELCGTQKEILLKVISLCCKCPDIDPLRAKVWADKGSKLCAGHPAVFELKWYLHSLEAQKDYEEMELLMADELTRRARDSDLHIKLVNMYTEAGSHQRAYFHCTSVENTNAFHDSLLWLECACDVFDNFRKVTKDGKLKACLNYALTLCKLIKLHMKLSNSRIVSIVLKRLDDTILEFVSVDADDVVVGLSSEWKDCLTELRGQLYLNSAIFIMKLGHENVISWMKANRMACALLMASWLIEAPPLTQKLFSRRSPLKKQNQPSYEWSALACARLSQSGHLILSMESKFGEDWIENCVSDFCTEHGRRALVQTLASEDALRTYLELDEEFLKVELKIPDLHVLVQYDEVTVAENAQDLHLIIWLGLHWDDIREYMRPGVGVMVGRLFEGIGLDVKNMNNCHFSSMCLRDVEAFIYGVIRSSKSTNIECQRHEDALKLLPLEISVCLVTSAQREWWEAAYGLYTGKVGTHFAAKLKMILQKGLETLRCLKDHSIDPRILIYIAVAFWEKASSIEAAKDADYDYQDHWQSLQNRGVYYLKEALRLLEIYKRDKVVPIKVKPLIPPLSEPLLFDDVITLLNHNYLKLADSARLSGDWQQALKYYNEVKSVKSVYSQAQIYIHLASECDMDTLEGEKDNLYYTTKAKERLSTCISNPDCSNEFKQHLTEQLQGLQTSSNLLSNVKPSPLVSKKCLDFQDLLANDDSASQLSYNESEDISIVLEKSTIQKQLDAREKENEDLRKQLDYIKSQIDNMQQRYHAQPQQPFSHYYPPMSRPPHPMIPPHVYMQQSTTQPHAFPPQSILSSQLPCHGGASSDHSPTYHAPSSTLGHVVPHTMAPQLNQMPPATAPQASVLCQVSLHDPLQHSFPHGGMAMPHQYMYGAPLYSSNSMTPNVLNNGLETPNDLWWDSFSPETSFQKGYFAGLAEHVEQAREQSGEGEAPTLRDEDNVCDDVGVQTETLSTIPLAPVTTSNKQNTSIRSDTTPVSPTLIPEGDDIYVEPIVKLSQKSNVVTGEENETTKFVHRAKLYRFDKDTSQWKERGIGDVKILYNDKHSKGRITMRRDAIFIVCCNHAITADMSLESKANSKAAWTWYTAADVAEEQVKPQQFTIKFKTQDVADDFKKAFVECQQLFVSTQPDDVAHIKTKGDVTPKANTPKAPIVRDSLFNFKAPENTVTQSPEGRPLFNFAPSNTLLESATTSANSFLSNTMSFPAFIKDSFKPTAVENLTATEATQNPFAGFAFTVSKTHPPTTPALTTTTKASVPAASSSSPFNGFSFSSSKPAMATATTNVGATAAVSDTTSGAVVSQKFPMMSSLLQTTATTPQKSDHPEPIPGMSKLPVFEKGVMQTGIDPSSFWSSISTQRSPFFGNTLSLDAIGHQAEPREVDEEEFFLDAMQANRDAEEEVAAARNYERDDYYYGHAESEFYEGGYYGDENNEDYDYEPDEDFEDYDEDYDDDDDDDDYQPSKASSSRLNSNEDLREEINEMDRQVEDRFDVPKKPSNVNINDIVDSEVTVTYEVKPSFDQKMKANRLQLPPGFYLYQSKTPCPGCKGCRDFKPEDKQTKPMLHPDRGIEETAFDVSQVTSTSSFGFGLKPGATSFAALATSPSQGFSAVSGSFAGAGAQLFSSATNNVDEGVARDDYDPHYEAIVQVTKLDNVVTGEEDDKILFKHRAKLYRFDQQWKEKGVGDIKLTINVKTGYCRVLMRRDIILKLCANHAVMPTMTLKPLATSDKSLVWFTPSDYSDGAPPVPENFCVKFKNKDIADEFVEKFEMCKKLMVDVVKHFSKQLHEKEEAENAQNQNTVSADMIGNRMCNDGESDTNVFSKFAMTTDEWECSSCYVRNKLASFRCVSCEMPNPNPNNSKTQMCSVKNPFGSSDSAVPVSESTSMFASTLGLTKGSNTVVTSASVPSMFKFGTQESGAVSTSEKPVFKFGTQETTAPNSDKTVFMFGIQDSAVLTGDKPTFKFGSQDSVFTTSDKPTFKFGSQDSASATGDKPTFKFGSASTCNDKPLFNFGTEASVSIPSNDTSDVTVATKKMDTSFGGGNHIFQMGTRHPPMSIVKGTEGCQIPDAAQEVSSPSKYNDLEDPDIHVEAIVKVTKLENIETGEENEETLFSHRAKMYRYDLDAKQWKEKGIGDVKLSRNKTDNSCRVIMRREHIHKLCANHAILACMELKPMNKSDKAWTWFTQADFAEEEVKPQQLALKFKDAEVASEFKEAFGTCKNIVFNREKQSANINSNITNRKTDSKGVFSRFTPKPGSWSCPTCLIDNPGEQLKCLACETLNSSKEGFSNQNSNSHVGKGSVSSFGSNATTQGFSFGREQVQDPSKMVGLASRFALKPGSWCCEVCMIDNDKETVKCAACETPNPNKFYGGTSSVDAPQTVFGSSAAVQALAVGSTSTDSLVTTRFSFGTSTSASTASTGFAFGTAHSTKSTGFSFGAKSVNATALTTFAVTTAPAVSTPSRGFTFTVAPAVSTTSTGFTFETKPTVNENPYGFSFGTTPGVSTTSTMNLSSQETSRKPVLISAEKNFNPDPDTWECPSCLSKNSSERVFCRSCEKPKEKTPVVKLDPSKFSSPIVVPGQLNQTEAIGKKLFPTDAVVPVSSSSALFDGKTSHRLDVGSGFFLAKKDNSTSTSTKSAKESEANDRELMPPPSGFPISVIKNSPKQIAKPTESRKESTFSWTPQGLSTESLFSFGTAPSPSLSAASSVDDLTSHACGNVQSAFSNALFTFSLDLEKVKESKTADPKVNFNSAVSPPTPKTPGEGDDNDADVSIEFKPLVSLQQVSMTTGEENDVEVFNARCKMFRFDKQWKERGVGDLKILRNLTTNQHRLIMRREQIHKLCANHALFQGMTIQCMTGNKKSFVWKTAADISDDTAKEQTFAARFKNEEIAGSFADAFAKACTEKTSEVTDASQIVAIVKGNDVVVISDDDDGENGSSDAVERPSFDFLPEDVEVVYGYKTTDELKTKAKALLLPAAFYHEPSVAIGVRPSRTYGETSRPAPVSADTVERDQAPELILTHQRISDEQLTKKSDNLLLPTSFYNFDHSCLADESVQINTEQKIQQLPPEEIVYDDLMSLYSPFVKTDDEVELFNKPGVLFKYSPKVSDFVEVTEGVVVILRNNISNLVEVLLLADNNACLQREINESLKLILIPNSKTMFELQSDGSPRYAVKFFDLENADNFKIEFENVCAKGVTAGELQANSSISSPSSGFVFGKSTSSLSFKSLAVSNESGFTNTAGKSFAGAGSSVFGNVGIHNDDVQSTVDGGDEGGHIYVEPIVQLTSVDVVSGEEGEKVIFAQRCKLYRFDGSTKKWKERGVGELKLLQHLHSGKPRLVMRRDQVRKLCANHLLNPSMKLEPFKTNDLTVTWHAIGDISGTTPEDCLLAARFKNSTLLTEFQEKFVSLCNGENRVAIQMLHEVSNEQPTQQRPLFGSCDPKLIKDLSSPDS